MVNNRKKILFLKYGSIILIYLLLYVLQTTPRFLVVGVAKPMLLIPAAVVVAMYEGEFSGGILGAAAGILCDLGSFSLYGLYSILLFLCACATGLLVIYWMRCTVRVALLLTLATSLICYLSRFYIDYGLWGYEGIGSIFLKSTLPGILLSTGMAPVFYWIFGRVEEYFNKKLVI